MYLFVSNIRQNEISFAIKIHINIPLFFSKPWFREKDSLQKKSVFFVDYVKIIELHVVHTWRRMQSEWMGNVGNDINKKDL